MFFMAPEPVMKAVPPAGPGPVIPFDVYVAARFFMATGRTLDDVLA